MKSRAFTLIELLVVIAIIAIMAAILFPVFQSAKSAAKATTCMSNLKQIGMSMFLYQSDNDDGFPNNGDPYLWVGRRFRWPIMPYLGAAQSQSSTSFDKIGTDPSVLLCPADTLSGPQFDATSYAYSVAFYQNASVLPSLGIVNLINGIANPGAGANPTTQFGSSVSQISRKVMVTEYYNSHSFTGKGPIGFWGTLGPGLTPGADRFTGRRNYLFTDLHASSTPTSRIKPNLVNCPDPNLTEGGIAGSDLKD